MVTQARYLTAFPQVDEEIRVLKEIYGPDYAVPEGMRPAYLIYGHTTTY